MAIKWCAASAKQIAGVCSSASGINMTLRVFTSFCPRWRHYSDLSEMKSNIIKCSQPFDDQTRSYVCSGGALERGLGAGGRFTRSAPVRYLIGGNGWSVQMKSNAWPGTCSGLFDLPSEFTGVVVGRLNANIKPSAIGWARQMIQYNSTKVNPSRVIVLLKFTAREPNWDVAWVIEKITCWSRFYGRRMTCLCQVPGLEPWKTLGVKRFIYWNGLINKADL